MIKPKLFISACLEFDKVRYDGQMIPSKIVRDLVPYVDFIKTCPENEIGLGVPREPIRVVRKNGELRLVQHKTEKDVTDAMNNFTDKFISTLKDVDGFIFKSKSPTMGLSGIKIYSGIEKGSGVVGSCGGFFAGKIANIYDGYPIEEDDRLRNPKIRHHFLTKLFLFARFRKAKEEGSLDDFHQNNSLLMKYYNKDLFNSLIVGDEDYIDTVKRIFHHPPRSIDIANFFDEIIDGRKSVIDKYRENKVDLITIKEVTQVFIKDRKLLTQTFFNPYPEQLILSVDEDRDKNYWQ